MAYEPELQPSENLIGRFFFHVSKKTKPFAIAVSDQALYWPEVKLFALSDPYHFRRVPNGQVREVRIRRLSPHWARIFAVLMVIVGVYATCAMMKPVLMNQRGNHRVSGWPIAAIVGGLILPFAARGRYSLQVETSDRGFRWKPPLTVDDLSRQKATELFNDISRACQKAGLRVLDEREART